MPNSPHGVSYESYRPVVMGRNGMVCSGHPLASQAGIAMLQRGGNYADAALATAAALNVVEPLMSGVGGDGFIMVYRKDTDILEVSNGTGAAPYAATRDRYLPEGIPMKGIMSVSVPGLVNSWLDVHEKHGLLSLAECFAPAIDLAANGFPRHPRPVQVHRSRPAAVPVPHLPGRLCPRWRASPSARGKLLPKGSGPHVPEDRRRRSGGLL